MLWKSLEFYVCSESESIYLGFYMREVVLNKIQIPDFSDRLAEYEAERAEGAALKDCFDEIHFQTRYVNKLGKYM